MKRAFSSLVLTVALALSAGAQESGKGSVAGRVVDEGGEGIEGARVQATALTGRTGEATTDAKGAFQLELDPGEYRLEFEAEGYANTSLRQNVLVTAGRRTKVKHRVEMPAAEQGTVVRGSVFTEEGRSLQGAKVVIERVRPDGGAPFERLKLESRSDRMGVFAFRLPKGEARYRITATHDGFDPRSLDVDASGGEILNVAVKLPPTSPPR
jgi:hypothetical protein